MSPHHFANMNKQNNHWHYKMQKHNNAKKILLKIKIKKIINRINLFK